MASAAPASQRPKIKNPEFINTLKEKQLLPEDFIQDLLAEFDGNALDVLMTLIQTGYGSKQELCQIWCNSIGIAHVDLEKTLFQPNIVRKLPEWFAREYYAIPVYQMGDTITVATATPQNKKILKEIELRIGGPINLVFALPQDIEWAIEQEYRTNTALQEFLKKISASRALTASSRITVNGLQKTAGEESINQLHVAIILVGITENASEIIIEPSAEEARIYFVENQTASEKFLLDLTVYQTLTTNLKKLAKVEKNTADASRYTRILFPTPGKKYDIQFSSIPAETGEKLFLKLMAHNPLPRLPQLPDLYMSKKLQQFITRQLEKSGGFFLIAGPNSDEHSAIAYAMISQFGVETGKCIAIEDEIRYLLKGVEQYQVTPEARQSRKDLLESCLRQHPKLIFIQNADDAELMSLLNGINTADQIVIAGINAEDAFHAVYRTLQLGNGESVTAVLVHQPASRLCEHCKEKYQLSEQTVHSLFIADEKTRVPAWKASGCAYCQHTGFSGTINVYEHMPLTSELKELAAENTGRADFYRKAGEYDHDNLMHDGIKKVLRGLVPLVEIERIQSRAE